MLSWNWNLAWPLILTGGASQPIQNDMINFQSDIAWPLINLIKAYVKILSNWFRSDVPGNKARRENNSAIMHAELQMSTLLLYGWLSNTSGARYHNVTTYGRKLCLNRNFRIDLKPLIYLPLMSISFQSHKSWLTRSQPIWCARRRKLANFVASDHGE